MKIIEVLYDKDSNWRYKDDVEDMVKDVEKAGITVLKVVPDSRIPYFLDSNSSGQSLFMRVDKYPFNSGGSRYKMYRFTEKSNDNNGIDKYSSVLKDFLNADDIREDL